MNRVVTLHCGPSRDDHGRILMHFEDYYRGDESDLVKYDEFKSMFPGILETVSSKRHKIEADPMVAWTQIRSYIKGSYEAWMDGGCLTEESYLNLDVMAENRCNLSVDKRADMYKIFKEYEAQRTSTSNGNPYLYDEADVVMDILMRISKQKGVDGGFEFVEAMDFSPCGGPYDKVYVDEVQV